MITRECHPTQKFGGSISSHKANIIITHDDTLGVDPGMGFPHVDLNPIPIPIDLIPESLDMVLAPRETSSLGCPKLVEDLEDNVHHTSTASGEYISPHTLSLVAPLPPKDLYPEIDLNGNFPGTDVTGNYLTVGINDNLIGIDVNGNLLGDNPNDNISPDEPLNCLGLFLMAKGQLQ